MTPGTAITYLRRGRRVRASGIVIATRGGLAQVKPANGKWKSVWLTPAEIADGAAKLPPIPRRAAVRCPGRAKPVRPHHPAMIALWQHLHRECEASLIPNPSPTFILAWNHGHLTATQELIPATLPPSESHQSPPKPVP